MKQLAIANCSVCPFLDHTGNFGGTGKNMCAHKEALKDRRGAEGGLSKLTLTEKWPRPPKWCPLPDKEIEHAGDQSP